MIKILSQWAINLGFLPILSWMVRGYAFLLRSRTIDEHLLKEKLERKERVILAIWHQRILAVMPHAIRYGLYSPAVMISRSRDGELIADFYQRLGFHPVRGSSSRGGKEGLRALINYLEDHLLAVHVVDGPQGPAGVVKEGLISLAENTGATIVPIYVSASRLWVLNSWDRFIIPKPISTVITRLDKPIEVPSSLSYEERESLRRRLEAHMLENQRRDDALFGHDGLI
ncbi:MAG TPA: lysophospholipid acyltransferase family protein [Syntrophales bacterium]|nr:lysophospholipid acyltransferase family protein [Syntrophales bacterium]HOL58293.1 lysophospholipid acyltransferase family protein [Syntrophales bacterium]HPO34462.1 lysophospholipid acyltransferase family protein [Syntrophales bacterium]